MTRSTESSATTHWKLALLFCCAVLIIAPIPRVADAHSFVTLPISRGNQRWSQLGCTGPQCLRSCELPSSLRRDPIIVQRGWPLNIQWPRGGHPGGFVRFAWSRTNTSDSFVEFERNIQYYTCFERGSAAGGACAPADGLDPNGIDYAPLNGSTNACNFTFSVPRHLPDGLWTLQWAWYGGGPSFGTYFSCVDYQVTGGPVAPQLKPIFEGGDFSNPRKAGDVGKCKFFNTNELHMCPVTPCVYTQTPGERVGMPAATWTDKLEYISADGGTAPITPIPTDAPKPPSGSGGTSGGVDTGSSTQLTFNSGGIAGVILACIGGLFMLMAIGLWAAGSFRDVLKTKKRKEAAASTPASTKAALLASAAGSTPGTTASTSVSSPSTAAPASIISSPLPTGTIHGTAPGSGSLATIGGTSASRFPTLVLSPSTPFSSLPRAYSTGSLNHLSQQQHASLRSHPLAASSGPNAHSPVGAGVGSGASPRAKPDIRTPLNQDLVTSAQIAAVGKGAASTSSTDITPLTSPRSYGTLTSVNQFDTLTLSPDQARDKRKVSQGAGPRVTFVPTATAAGAESDDKARRTSDMSSGSRESRSSSDEGGRSSIDAPSNSVTRLLNNSSSNAGNTSAPFSYASLPTQSSGKGFAAKFLTLPKLDILTGGSSKSSPKDTPIDASEKEGSTTPGGTRGSRSLSQGKLDPVPKRINELRKSDQFKGPSDPSQGAPSTPAETTEDSNSPGFDLVSTPGMSSVTGSPSTAFTSPYRKRYDSDDANTTGGVAGSSGYPGLSPARSVSSLTSANSFAARMNRSFANPFDNANAAANTMSPKPTSPNQLATSPKAAKTKSPNTRNAKKSPNLSVETCTSAAAAPSTDDISAANVKEIESSRRVGSPININIENADADSEVKKAFPAPGSTPQDESALYVPFVAPAGFSSTPTSPGQQQLTSPRPLAKGSPRPRGAWLTPSKPAFQAMEDMIHFQQARAVKHYFAKADDELSVKKGDLVNIVGVETYDGFYMAEVDGRTGKVPISHMRPLTCFLPNDPTQLFQAPVQLVRAVHDYIAKDADELTIAAGDVVEVLAEYESGWWLGNNKGNVGLFPSNFTEMLQ